MGLGSKTKKGLRIVILGFWVCMGSGVSWGFGLAPRFSTWGRQGFKVSVFRRTG